MLELILESNKLFSEDHFEPRIIKSHLEDFRVTPVIINMLKKQGQSENALNPN